MNRYTIAPGETLDYAFDFNGPNPGPALRVGQTLDAETVTTTGGLVVVTDSISGGKVLARVSCPDATPLGTRATIRCRVTTAGVSAGEVLVDQIDVLVAV
jgi:hypothetical protein